MLRNWLGDWVGTFLGESRQVASAEPPFNQMPHLSCYRSQGSGVVEQDLGRYIACRDRKCRFHGVSPCPVIRAILF